MRFLWIFVWSLASVSPGAVDAPCHGDCRCDYDDGSGTGTPDGGCTIDDFIYWLRLYADGDACADIDDGTMTHTSDGGVTIDDLLYYLCCVENNDC